MSTRTELETTWRQVEGFRADKDDVVPPIGDSPIPHEVRHDFPGLPYFPVDEALRFEDLALAPYAGDGAVRVPDPDLGRAAAARPSGRHVRVRARRRAAPADRLRARWRRRRRHRRGDSVFVPFLDATSGHETYGAGRYLDLEPEQDGTYVLDFNLAYHPSCVYAPNYSCPLTPAENRLPVRIEAGERLPEDAPPA